MLSRIMMIGSLVVILLGGLDALTQQASAIMTTTCQAQTFCVSTCPGQPGMFCAAYGCTGGICGVMDSKCSSDRQTLSCTTPNQT